MISFIIGANIKKAMGVRKDGSPQLRFFHAFEYGASTSSFSFLSGNNRLYGECYFYGKGPYKAVVVFFHGFGAGHESYTQEICKIAKAGYLVYAYDNTGCVQSEGKSVVSLTQSLFDQNAFFEFLDNDEQAKGLPRYVAGHSWGGYTALGALQPSYNVAKCVSIAGFLSVKDAVLHAGPSFMKKYGKAVDAFQKREYGPLGVLDTVDLLNKTKAKVLYIQGDKDRTCPFEDCYKVLESKVNNPNLTLYKVEGLGHQPYWTKSAQAYYEELSKKMNIFGVNRDLGYEVDYKKLNEDNPKVIQAIIDFLDA